MRMLADKTEFILGQTVYYYDHKSNTLIQLKTDNEGYSVYTDIDSFSNILRIPKDVLDYNISLELLYSSVNSYIRSEKEKIEANKLIIKTLELQSESILEKLQSLQIKEV